MPRLTSASSADKFVSGDEDSLKRWPHGRWLWIMAATTIGGILLLAVSFLITPMYRANAVLVPSDEITGAGQISALGQLGGLASLVGSGASLGNRSNEAIAVLQSRILIEKYIQDRGLLPILFYKDWDDDARGWRPRLLRKVPTLIDAYKLFTSHMLSVRQDRRTGLIDIYVDWKDPSLAKEWVYDLVVRANEYLRNDTIARGNKNLSYLNGQIEKTTVVELRTTLSKLIETEIKKVMLAQGNGDYAFRFIDPPEIPQKPISPVKWQYFLGGAVATLSAILGLLGMPRLRGARFSS